MRLFVFLVAALPLLAQKRIAITIDDLPYAGSSKTLANAKSANDRMLAALQAARAPAIGFVNEQGLQVDGERDARVALLKQWLDAGMTLANHTYSHADLNTMALAEFEDEVGRGEVVTRALDPKAKKYLRYPFNHTGGGAEKKAEFERFLASRGYAIAPFTIEHADYWFNEMYETLLSRGEAAQAERVRLAYVEYLPVVLAYFEKLSKEYFGRDIAQIFLIHVNEINAKSLRAMLEAMQSRGYSFVTMEEALQDAAYRTPDLYAGSAGLSWLHRWSMALQRPMDVRNEPDPPKWLFALKKSLGK